MHQALRFALLAVGVTACHRSCSYSGSTSVSFGPDAGAVAFSSSIDAGAEAATGAVAPIADASAVPARFDGVFHLPGLDEVNLALSADGTYHWRFFGCGPERTACGSWVTKGNLVVLAPTAGAKTMDWIDGATVKANVTHVDVAEHGGRLEVRGYRNDGSSFAQVWLQGRVCKDCSSPTPVAPVACSTPFPSTCP